MKILDTSSYPANVRVTLSDCSPECGAQSTNVEDYAHFELHEDANPLLVAVARRVHAQGYLNAKYVSDDAIIDGELVPELDKARGSNVAYHLAINQVNPTDMATMRLSGIPEDGESWTALPLGDFKDAISPDFQKIFIRRQAEGKVIREVGALAHTSRPNGLHEIIRKVIQTAYGNDEVWLATIVLPAYRSLGLRYGKSNVELIGNDITITDARVRKNLPLKPTLILPDSFFDNIVFDYDASKSTLKKRELGKAICFLVEGFDESRLSDRVQVKLEDLRSRIAI